MIWNYEEYGKMYQLKKLGLCVDYDKRVEWQL